MIASTPARTRPRKALGQHFLVDHRVLNRIVAAAQLTPYEVVVEIGPGLGTLTRRLVGRAGRVVAVELDPHLATALPSRLGYPPNLTVIEADARTVEVGPLVGRGVPYKVVANLPYYAANPIVRRFLESEHRPSLMVVMVQQEVARSMAASPGQMSYLSVLIQYHAVASLVCSVPPAAFRPPPKVTSAVVRLELRQRPAVEVADPEGFFALARAGFTAPRKQLRNSLSHGLDIPASAASALLADLELDGARRAETLSLEEWAQVYRAWERRSKKQQ